MFEDDLFAGDYHVKDKARAARYAKALHRWFNEGLERAITRAGMVPDRWKLALGCIVYGDKFVGRFLDYCVPSLRAAGNLPAVADSPVWLIIQTDAASIPRLKADPGLNALAALGVCIEIQTVPQEVIDGAADEDMNKYWLIGAAHNLQMQQAKYMGYGFHMLMPDHVYSENYFTNLRRLAGRCDAIAQGALSARIETAAAALASDGVLAVGSRELNAIGLDHLHRQYHPYVMNGRDVFTDCPIHSFMFFVGYDAVHLVCPHMSPVYLSHAALVRCPPRLFNTIDSQLPFFVPDHMRCLMPTPDDDMTYIELSDDSKPCEAPEPSDLMAFCIRFWMLVYCETGFLRYMDMDNVLALPDGYRHAAYKPMPKTRIRALKAAVRKAVRSSLPQVKPILDPKYHKDPLPQRAA